MKFKDYECDMESLVKIEYYKGHTTEYYEDDGNTTVIIRYKNHYVVYFNGEHIFSKNILRNGNVQYITYYTTTIDLKVYEDNDSDKLVYEGNIPKELYYED